MPKEYRKKPVVIQAVQFDGSNFTEIIQWIESHPADPGSKLAWEEDGKLFLKTLETENNGRFLVDPQDFVIRGVKGEFYACKPGIFAVTYDPVD